MIAQLKEEHDRIRDIAGRLDVYLDQTSAPTNLEFARLRWMLMRELSVHLATERKALSEWQAKSGKRLEQFDRGLDEAFAAYAANWSGAAIPSAWDRYRSTTKMLLVRLRTRMNFEESSVLPTIASSSPVRV